MYRATADDNELWAACRAGDIRARERLIERHIPLARSIAREHSFYLGDASLERLDIVSCAYIGLIRAVDTFDAQRGVTFSTYAVPVIRNAIHSEMRRLKPLTWEAVRRGDEPPQLLSLDSPRFDEPDSDSLGDSMACQCPGPEEMLEASEEAAAVHQALSELSARERELLSMRYGEETTLEDLGTAAGVSSARVGQIHATALRRLRHMLAERMAVA